SDSHAAYVAARAVAAYAHHPGPRGALETALLGDLGTYLPHLLNRQDKNTMQHSIETRVPFLDPDVVALALNLPLEARATPERKGVLRDLARTHLPRGVAGRAKLGFAFDVRRYLDGLEGRAVGQPQRDVLQPPALVVGLVGVDGRHLGVVEVEHVDVDGVAGAALERRRHGAVGRHVRGVDDVEALEACRRDHHRRARSVGPELARDAGGRAVGPIGQQPARSRLGVRRAQAKRAGDDLERIAARPRQMGGVE